MFCLFVFLSIFWFSVIYFFIVDLTKCFQLFVVQILTLETLDKVTKTTKTNAFGLYSV